MERELNKNTDKTGSDGKSEGSSMMVSYSAPLPPPAMFSQYNAVVPNAAERILVMAEEQSKHRHFIEKFLIIGESMKSWIGLFFAFLVVVGGMAAGTFLIMSDKEITGLLSMFTPLALVAGIFIYKETTSKNKED